MRAAQEALSDVRDPLRSQLEAEYRTEFATALYEAIAVPDAEDRTLLRQQIVDGLSIQEIGAAFGLHCPTAARWLQRAHGALVTVTRNRLATHLKISVRAPREPAPRSAPPASRPLPLGHPSSPSPGG